MRILHLLQHIEMTVIGHNAICAPSYRAIHEFVILRVGLDQVLIIMGIHPMHIDPFQQYAHYVASRFPAHHPANDLLILQYNACRDQQFIAFLNQGLIEPVIARPAGEGHKQDIGINDGLERHG